MPKDELRDLTHQIEAYCKERRIATFYGTVEESDLPQVLWDREGSGDFQCHVGQLPLPFTLPTPYQVTNLATVYKVHVWDYDGEDLPPNPDDWMGGYQFSFSGFASAGYPTTAPPCMLREVPSNLNSPCNGNKNSGTSIKANYISWLLAFVTV